VNNELEILCKEGDLCGFGRIRLEKLKKTKKLSRVANFLFEIFRCKLGKKNCTQQYLYCRLFNLVNVLYCKMLFQFWIQMHDVSSEQLLETCFCDAY
jgi:hypothetical protein